MRKWSFALALLCCLRGQGQQIGFIKVDQLYERLHNGGDTVFVVNFWATWCGPCVKELPNFERLGAAHTAEKVKVLLISLDFKSKWKTSLLPFVKERKLKNEVFLLDETDQQVFINRIDSSWSGGLPSTLMVRKGKRSFFEKAFTYPELETEYQKIKQL